MRNEFNVTGLFYENGGYSFRKYLNIIKKDSITAVPDLMVVMMNPGSSRPIAELNTLDKETETIPDTTQSQIMKIMGNCGYNYARVLNLSDLREADSNEFYKTLNKLEEHKISHSIFSHERNDDFNKLFVNGLPVIYAWGVNKCLSELAKMTMEKVNVENYVGIAKVESEYAFYHPLPRVHTKQLEWVETITDILKSWTIV